MIKIQENGKVLIRTGGAEANDIRADDTARAADISLTWHKADRLGCANVLPLLLSCNLQDRI